MTFGQIAQQREKMAQQQGGADRWLFSIFYEKKLYEPRLAQSEAALRPGLDMCWPATFGGGGYANSRNRLRDAGYQAAGRCLTSGKIPMIKWFLPIDADDTVSIVHIV